MRRHEVEYVGQYLHVIRAPKEWILIGIRWEHPAHWKNREYFYFTNQWQYQTIYV